MSFTPLPGILFPPAMLLIPVSLLICCTLQTRHMSSVTMRDQNCTGAVQGRKPVMFNLNNMQT